jgi:hypothetical protein
MGHNALSDKLDQIQKEDLGIHFDEALLWGELKNKMEGKKVGFDYRLLIVACISFIILFAPFILVNNQVAPESEISSISSYQEIKQSEEAAIPRSEGRSIEKMAIHAIEKRPIHIEVSEVEQFVKLTIKPIEIVEYQEQKRQLFVNEDISIIQANLGTPSIEKGKSVSIRAQLRASSQPVELNNQVLIIKLYEISNNKQE